jgi:hypothetical protein
MRPYLRYVTLQAKAYAIQERKLTHTRTYKKIAGEMLDLFEKLSEDEIIAVGNISNELYRTTVGRLVNVQTTL